MPTGVYVRSNEQKKKMGERMKGNQHLLGYHHTEAAKIKMAQSQRGKHHTEETKAKIGQSLKGRHLTEETRAKLSQARKGKSYRLGTRHSAETKAALSQAATGRYPSEKTRKLLSEGLVTRYENPEARRKLSESLRKLFADPEYRERAIKVMRLGLHLKPNKAELRLLYILDKYFPGEWAYVGDGELIIGGKNPDFANIDGKKQLIELFGSYWHDIFDVAKRTEHFRSYGFRTVVIWEDELNDETRVVRKIKRFRGKGGARCHHF